LVCSAGKTCGSRTGDRVTDYAIKVGSYSVAEKLNTEGPIVTWYDRLVPRTENTVAEDQGNLYHSTGVRIQESRRIDIMN
jgi:hypothetical protein